MTTSLYENRTAFRPSYPYGCYILLFLLGCLGFAPVPLHFNRLVQIVNDGVRLGNSHAVYPAFSVVGFAEISSVSYRSPTSLLGGPALSHSAIVCRNCSGA